jgi:hypothetical protein
MKNYKVSLDLSDVFREIERYKLREFDAPFLIIFIQANDPDEVCYELVERLLNQLLRKDSSIKTRVLCRVIRKKIRFDRIEML